jgi:hypothetical protein
MSLTPAVAETLRQALATVVAVPVTPLHADGNPDWVGYATLTRRWLSWGLCRADVRPPSRPLPAGVKDEIRAILTSWSLT